MPRYMTDTHQSDSDDTSGWMLYGNPPPKPHICSTPHPRSTIIAIAGSPEYQPALSSATGGVWVCRCGQHWYAEPRQGLGVWWVPISARRARRLVRKATP